MNALQLRAFGKPTTAPELIDADAPAAGAGQVVVALEAAPINPSDLLLITGRYGVRPPLPAALGAEGVGRIVAVGGAVDPARIGERVLVVPNLEHGTWRDQTVVDESHVVPVDPKADPLQLSMLGINPLTAELLLHSFTDLAPGAWVGQTGANSAVGRYVIAIAQEAGVRTLNVVRRPEVAADLLGLGADAVVVSGPDLAEQVAAVLGDDQISLLLDAVGGEVVTELTHSLVFGGTVVSYGGMSGAAAGGPHLPRRPPPWILAEALARHDARRPDRRELWPSRHPGRRGCPPGAGRGHLSARRLPGGPRPCRSGRP